MVREAQIKKAFSAITAILTPLNSIDRSVGIAIPLFGAVSLKPELVAPVFIRSVNHSRLICTSYAFVLGQTHDGTHNRYPAR